MSSPTARRRSSRSSAVVPKPLYGVIAFVKILTVLGARPQFIKAATVSRILRDWPKAHEVIVHTGQHSDASMSEVFFEQLDIPRPAHHLGIGGLPHGAMTGRMIEAIEVILLHERPDCVLVYGDTNSTLAATVAAAKVLVPVVHVEAGLRSRSPRMPEETNRIVTDRLSSVLFCPTADALRNLMAEGFPFPSNGLGGTVGAQRIEQVGDVMFDALLHYKERVRAEISLDRWFLQDKGYALCTLHRQENTDDPARLQAIWCALTELAETMSVVLPLHPRTRKLLATDSARFPTGRLHLVDPLPYLEMQRLVMGARVILTDSGGLQKEAYFHGVPCVTLRDETEWVETVEAGWNVLAGADATRIAAALDRMPVDSSPRPPFYGTGDAAVRIVKSLCDNRVSW